MEGTGWQSARRRSHSHSTQLALLLSLGMPRAQFSHKEHLQGRSWTVDVKHTRVLGSRLPFPHLSCLGNNNPSRRGPQSEAFGEWLMARQVSWVRGFWSEPHTIMENVDWLPTLDTCKSCLGLSLTLCFQKHYPLGRQPREGVFQRARVLVPRTPIEQCMEEMMDKQSKFSSVLRP